MDYSELLSTLFQILNNLADLYIYAPALPQIHPQLSLKARQTAFSVYKSVDEIIKISGYPSPDPHMYQAFGTLIDSIHVSYGTRPSHPLNEYPRL